MGKKQQNAPVNPSATDSKFVQNEIMQKSRKLTDTLAYWYSFDNIWQELPNKYQQDMVMIFFDYFFDYYIVIFLGEKASSARKGLRGGLMCMIELVIKYILLNYNGSIKLVKKLPIIRDGDRGPVYM